MYSAFLAADGASVATVAAEGSIVAVFLRTGRQRFCLWFVWITHSLLALPGDLTG